MRKSQLKCLEISKFLYRLELQFISHTITFKSFKTVLTNLNLYNILINKNLWKFLTCIQRKQAMLGSFTKIISFKLTENIITIFIKQRKTH